MPDREKCALVDSHARSRGKTLRHIRSEPLRPQRTFKSMAPVCQDLLTDPYFSTLFFYRFARTVITSASGLNNLSKAGWSWGCLAVVEFRG